MKVGITGQDKSRLADFTGAGWDVLLTYLSDSGARVRYVETHFFRWLRRELRLPQHLGQDSMGGLGGASETFSAEVGDQVIRAKLEALIETAERLSTEDLSRVEVTRPRLK